MPQRVVFAAQHHDIHGRVARDHRADVLGCLDPLDRTIDVITQARAPPLQAIQPDHAVCRHVVVEPDADRRNRTHPLERRKPDRHHDRVHGEQRRDRNGGRHGRRPAIEGAAREEQDAADGERRRQQNRGRRQLEVEVELKDAEEGTRDDHDRADAEDCDARRAGLFARAVHRVAPRARGEQAARRRRRKDVVVELEPREREKPDHDGRPQPEQLFVEGEPASAGAAPHGIDPAPDHDDRPREKPPDERPRIERVIDRAAREPRRLREVPDVPREQVIVEEPIAEVERHPDEPGGGGQERRGEPADPVEAREPFARVRPERIAETDEQPDEDRRDRPFRHRRQRQQRVAGVLDAAAALRARDQQTRDGAEEKRREDHIEQRDARQREGGGNGREHDRAPLPDLLLEEHEPQPPRDREQPDRGERGRQPHGEFGFAEQPDGASLQPVKEDGLVDERNPVEQRHQPAVRPQHLARQLCVVRLVRIEEAQIAEAPEDNRPPDRDPAKAMEPQRRHPQPRDARLHGARSVGVIDQAPGHGGNHIPYC